MAVNVIGSLSGHGVACAFSARVFRSWVPSLPRRSGMRRSGLRGDKAGGRTLGAVRMTGLVGLFREHVGELDPFASGNETSKKSGVRVTKWRNGNRRATTSPKRVTEGVGDE